MLGKRTPEGRVWDEDDAEKGEDELGTLGGGGDEYEFASKTHLSMMMLQLTSVLDLQ